MKIPGPDHPIEIAANPNKVRVVFAGRVIAETTRAVTLREASYPPVQYIPREDVRMELLERAQHSTHCPYKGDAAYYDIKAGDRTASKAVWTYEEAYPSVAEIEGKLAFYPDRVDSIEDLPAETASRK
jgi:uncharacterized protein (DUF427 family)